MMRTSEVGSDAGKRAPGRRRAMEGSESEDARDKRGESEGGDGVEDSVAD